MDKLYLTLAMIIVAISLVFGGYKWGQSALRAEQQEEQEKKQVEVKKSYEVVEQTKSKINSLEDIDCNNVMQFDFAKCKL